MGKFLKMRDALINADHISVIQLHCPTEDQVRLHLTNESMKYYDISIFEYFAMEHDIEIANENFDERFFE